MATRSDIRTQARIRADQDNSTFPTDTQYNILIDSAGREVWYDLVRAGWPIGGDLAAASLSSAGLARFTSELGVSAAVAFVQGVFVLEGGTYHELVRLNEGDRAALMSTTASRPTHYDLFFHPTEGLTVQLYPPAAAQVRVRYTVEWPGFANDAAVWPGPARSDELVSIKAAIKGCRKEGNDQGARELEREYGFLLQSVQDMASWTNMRHAATIRDVGNPLGSRRMPGDFDVYGSDF